MEDDIPADLELILLENDYICIKKLSTGEIAAILKFIFTWDICVGLDETGYRTRFSYKNIEEAIIALLAWDGNGDPPGPLIKQKGGVERWNPENKPPFTN